MAYSWTFAAHNSISWLAIAFVFFLRLQLRLLHLQVELFYLHLKLQPKNTDDHNSLRRSARCNSGGTGLEKDAFMLFRLEIRRTSFVRGHLTSRMGKFQHRIQQNSSNSRFEIIFGDDKGILHSYDPRRFQRNTQEIPAHLCEGKGRSVYILKLLLLRQGWGSSNRQSADFQE